MPDHRFLSGSVVAVRDPGAFGHLPRHHLPRWFGCGPDNNRGLGIACRFPGNTVVAEPDAKLLRLIGTTLPGETRLAEQVGRKLWSEDAGRPCVDVGGLYPAVGGEHFAELIRQLDHDQLDRMAAGGECFL